MRDVILDFENRTATTTMTIPTINPTSYRLIGASFEASKDNPSQQPHCATKNADKKGENID